jgi:hypothetical protein
LAAVSADGHRRYQRPIAACLEPLRHLASIQDCASGDKTARCTDGKETERWDAGVKGELVGKAEDWPGGFAATYKVTAPVDPKHPSLTFLAVWKVGGELLECAGRVVPNEKARDQVRAMCKSARW